MLRCSVPPGLLLVKKKLTGEYGLQSRDLNFHIGPARGKALSQKFISLIPLFRAPRLVLRPFGA